MTELEFLPLALEHRGEGVCIQLRLGPYWLLLDCGLKDISSLLSYAEQAPWTALLCSHAHADHARGIRQLHELLPELPIYTSEITARLLPLLWPDQPQELASLCLPLPWEKTRQIAPDLYIQILPAGHLPGAACFAIRYLTAEREYRVLYTGDFFLSNSRLVDGLPLEAFREQSPDVLIIEGTLGAKRYPHRRSQENELAAKLSRELAAGKSAIVPVPKLGVAQEILMLLRSHHNFTGKDIDIWVDDPIALVCDRYLQFVNYLPSSVQNFAQNQPLFWDRKVKPRVGRVSEFLGQDGEDSWSLIIDDYPSSDAIDQPEQPIKPKRSLRKTKPTSNLQDDLANSDLEAELERDQETQPKAESAINSSQLKPFILLVDIESNWQQWLERLACEWVVMLPEANETNYLPWRSPFPYQTYILNEHSDVSATTQLIHNLKPQHVVLMHGKPSDLADLANLTELRNRYHIHCPAIGKRLQLPVNDALQTSMAKLAAPTFPNLSPYEGELAQQDSTIMLTLPAEITSDPRWLDFADTGLIEARWQGEELLIRGISQRELMAMSAANSPNLKLYSCGNCRFYQQRYCQNSKSPLYGLKVSSDGYCQVFEAIDPVPTKPDSLNNPTNLDNPDNLDNLDGQDNPEGDRQDQTSSETINRADADTRSDRDTVDDASQSDDDEQTI
ncbi:beta-lactamase domain protein [Thalassoporum mexicanum PCC 7367]|uniref:MBL fold metallo-hydrolase n=1 Tax=Thalassoporum mexicanum TaxID=3457544 RepID=UPI00029FC342|nr:MBL fold metallo-hydrolase [Pseudanabaena sp. PCC 7367]AFY71078.1 beta-lactamase domain protein [Pseudanabaena sp. PCC 7367]